MKAIDAIEAMCDSGVFTRDEMREWEEKATADKIWVHFKAYFTKIYKKNQCYGGTAAQGHGYGEGTSSTDQNPVPANFFKEGRHACHHQAATCYH